MWRFRQAHLVMAKQTSINQSVYYRNSIKHVRARKRIAVGYQRLLGSMQLPGQSNF